MEVLKYTDIEGANTARAIYEGRMVRMDAHGWFDLPHNAAQASLAKYLIAWPVENRQLPIYQPYPTFTRALRYGFDQTANTPFSATAYTWYPKFLLGLQ